MAADHDDPPYLMGRTEEERGRLQRQAQLYGPLTRQLFADAGIGRGMRVLDVGSGVGDVALLVADLVGPTGGVVGIDIDAEALRVARARVQASGWQNVAFVEGDVRDAEIEGAFDAAVGRFVLVWVGDVVEVLRACAGRVRPGGVVAFQEHDVFGSYQAFPPVPFLERVRDWGHRFLERQGGDPAAALRLHANYLAAGLPDPQLRYDAPLGGGAAWPGYAAFADHIQRAAPALAADGLASPEELEGDALTNRLRDEVVGQHGVLRCLPAVGVWARVPTAGKGPARP